MSFAALLTHTVTIERPGSVDPDVVDEYGHPVEASPTTSTAKAAIQPKRATEVAQTTQAGVAVSDHRIFLLPTTLTTADAILHDASDCPMSPDLPDARYEVVGVPNAAGLGHHLEVDAKLIGGIAEAGA